MPSDLFVPMLACRDLDESLPFYEALGFTPSFRQMRPNPYAVVHRGDLDLHLYGVPGLDPTGWHGSVLLVTDDPGSLYATFAAGLRAARGGVPIVGVPRITRPRRQAGGSSGFSVVDPAGNWLRVVRRGDGARDDGRSAPLVKAVEAAARLADGKGDLDAAAAALDRVLARHTDPDVDRARALLYRAELAVRQGDRDGARAALAALDPLPASVVEAVAEERAELERELGDAAGGPSGPPERESQG